MTYNKPEIAVLGDAFHVIQGSKPSPGFEAPSPTNQQSSYELDE